jgi:oxygen-independent coproporphyrinogen-3 oxidase
MARLECPPLSLYVHLPWCVRKCPYCDFNSHAIDRAVPEERYVSALLRDLEVQAPALDDRPLLSIFFGGGTPSLFSPVAIARVIEGARGRLAFAPDIEITLEANPGTIEHGRFSEFREAGVNRVSLGGQSFSARHLARLGRIHSPAETLRAAEELHAAGLSNFNIDLMYALPEQTVAEAVSDIERAIALGPAHVSHYQLTLEPGTVFFHRPPPLPDEEASWEMQVTCQDALGRAGFRQYEISAYAKDRRQCAHNLNYWRFGDYLGIGAGAHGKRTDRATGRIVRTEHVRQPGQYMMNLESGAGSPQTRLVPEAELPFEFMLNALRLPEGFSLRQFGLATRLDESALESTLEQARARGLLERREPDGWKPTSLGLRFLNDLQGLFLPASGGASPSGQGAMRQIHFDQ